MSTFALVSSVRQYRSLLKELIYREVSERYAGTALGLVWALLTPAFTVCIYVFLFSVVFRVRIEISNEMPLDYAAYILAGIVPWLTAQDALSKGPLIFTSNASLVKQVIFPIELLPIKSVVSSLVLMVVGLGILALYTLLRTGSISITWLLVPYIMFFQIVALIGMTFILGSLGVFFKDLKDFMPSVLMMAMYLMPIVYLPQWVPTAFQPIIYANPFSYMVWCYQDAVYFGRIAHPEAWIIFPLFAVFTLWLGLRLFDRLKLNFSTAM